MLKITDLMNRRKTIPSGLLVAAVFALLPISAEAQCSTGWNASGNPKILQRGQALPIELALQQKGVVISGTAKLSMFSEGRQIQGTVDGTIDGNNFSIQIFWNNYTIGVYTGKVMPSGRLDGEGWEKNSPNVRVTWYSQEFLKCPPPPPKVLRATGRAKTKPATPTTPPSPPYIVASQTIFPVPLNSTGFVILTWDAGPGHPDAEVWLKTPGGAAAFSKLSKGGTQVPVERYRSYEYILTKSGNILAGVTFVAQ